MSGSAGQDLRAVDGARTVVEAYFATLPLEAFRTLIRASAEGDVNIRLLLELAALCDPRVRVRDELRSLGHEFYSPLLARWKTQNPGKRLTLLPGLQAYVLLTPGSDEKRDRKSGPVPTPAVGDVTINLQPLADPGFDWSEAQAVLHQIDEIGESARLWIHDAAERRPHLERVYGLAFQLLKAVERESLRVVPGVPVPGPGFESTLAVLKSDVDRAQQQFQRSAVQTADRVYLRGMVRRGLAILFLLCGVLAVCFGVFSVPAVTGIALPAGGIGAALSVFQRMHSGRSVVNFQTTADQLTLFGALRPLVGGVFGMFAYALIVSGLLGTPLSIPTQTGKALAYVAVVGFLAGFNERFAQDVVTSSERVSRTMMAN